MIRQKSVLADLKQWCSLKKKDSAEKKGGVSADIPPGV